MKFKKKKLKKKIIKQKKLYRKCNLIIFFWKMENLFDYVELSKSSFFRLNHRSTHLERKSAWTPLILIPCCPVLMAVFKWAKVKYSMSCRFYDSTSFVRPGINLCSVLFIFIIVAFIIYSRLETENCALNTPLLDHFSLK